MNRAALLLLFALPLYAQDKSSTKASSDASEKATKATADPSQTAVLAQADGQVTLSSTTDATDVRAEFGYGRPDPNGRGTLLTSLRIQAPIQKGGGDTDLTNLSGLVDGTIGSLRVTKISYGRHFDTSPMQAICDKHNATVARPPQFPAGDCTADGIRTILGKWRPTQDAQANEKQTALVKKLFAAAVQRGTTATCTEYNQSGGAYLGRNGNHQAVIIKNDPPPLFPIPQETCVAGLLNDGTNGDADQQVKELLTLVSNCATEATCWTKKLDDNVAKETKPFCQSINSDPAIWGLLTNCDTDALLALPEGEKLAEDAERAAHLSPVYYGLHIDYKPDTFKFADKTTLEERKEQHAGFGVGTTLGHLFVDSEWYVGGSATVERTFSAGAKPRQICKPLTSGATECSSVTLKPPEEKNHHLLELEGRHYITERFALMPRVTHDFHENHTAVELVAFLFTDPKNGLNGGIDIGYTKGQPLLRVFVGTAFKLFGE